MPCAFGTLTPKYSIFALTRGSATLCNSRSTAAFVQTVAEAGAWRALERFVGIEEDCDRPFIHQLHGHHRLKNPRRHGDSNPAQSRAKLFVQRLGQFRRRRG